MNEQRIDMEQLGFEPLLNYCGPDDEQRWLHTDAQIVVVGFPRTMAELLSRLWVDGYVACCEEMAHRARHIEQSGKMMPREIVMTGGVG